jgi:hypothetical protein
MQSNILQLGITRLPGRGRNVWGGIVPFTDGSIHVANTVVRPFEYLAGQIV